MPEASIVASIKSVQFGGTTHETGTITPSGSDRYLRVSVFIGDSSPETPTSVKFGGAGGVALTQIDSTVTVTIYGRLSVWYLKNPAASAGTVYITLANSMGEQMVIVEAIQDADQTTPHVTTAPATGTNTTPTVNATTIAGKLTLDSVAFLETGGAARTLAVGAGQTSIQEIEGSVAGGGTDYEGLATSYETAAGASTTMSWTISGAVDGWGIFPMYLNGSSGSPPAPTVKTLSALGVG